jgi:very-short-patch-repair endonuclease
LALTTKHHRPISTRLRRYARGMRRTSTSAEEAMWRILRARALSGYKFRRQAPVENFILDFVCFERRVIVEIDGSQHTNSHRDAARDKLLSEAGFETIRYWNDDVLTRPALVLEDLLARLAEEKGNPSPRSGLRPEPPSPTRGEG